MLLRIMREDITDASVSTVITLSDTPVSGEEGAQDDYVAGCKYLIKRPSLDISTIAQQNRDGGEITDLAYRNPTETCEITFFGTAAQMLGAMADIDEAAMDVVNWQRRKIGRYRIWLEYRPTDSGTIYRSELLSLQGDWGERPVDPMLKGTLIETFGLFWTRRYFWEDAYAADPVTNSGSYVLTSIPIKKSTGTYTTSVTIENHDDSDSGDDNWVQMQASDLKGTLPFQPIIRLTNPNVADTVRVYIGHRSFINTTEASNFTHILEGEDMTIGGSFSSQADAGASEGNYMEITWSDDTVIQAGWPEATITSAFLDGAGGEYYRFLGFFFDDGNNAHDPDSNFETRIFMRPNGGNAIVQTAWTRLEDGASAGTGRFIQELGTIRIPPYLRENFSDLRELELVINLRNLEEAGGHELNLDFVQLTPVEGFRKLIPLGFNVNQNVDLYDDHTLDEVYTSDPSKLGNYVAYGNAFTMSPTKAHRLYFLVTPATIDHQSTIRVYYRPRYLFPTG